MVCLPFHSGDLSQAKDLLAWIVRLGKNTKHECLLVADAGVQWDAAASLLNLAQETFGLAKMIATDKPLTSWPAAANQMFLKAAHYVNEPFLWLEPDCIPIKAGWLDAICDAYAKAGTPFMGAMMTCQQPGFPAVYLSGNAVYPANAKDIIEPFLWAGSSSWDIAAAQAITPLATNTLLIQNFWGQPKLPPTFALTRTAESPENTFTLDNLKPDAVLFHRNKDGTLLRLLRQKLFGVTKQPPITVVFPVCHGDIVLAIQHAKWLASMKRRWPNRAVIAHDTLAPAPQLSELNKLLSQCFQGLVPFRYPKPPQAGWPFAPNWSFQQTARHMAQQSNPWFWFEADAVVLKPEWLSRLQSEYERAEKPFMGPVVKGMGHINGGAIYPANTPFRIPKAMECTNMAWDYMMKPEMIHDCHDGSRLMQHIWTIVNGQASEREGGSEPRNVTAEQARRWIKPSSVAVHRVKDSSLVNLLLSAQFKP